MHIRQFGIKLERLKEEQIELVRHWRNAPEIRNFMEYKNYITPEMQLKWFQSLDRLSDFYFVIEILNEPVGLIHTSGVDWKDKIGHSGLFISKKELQGSHVPVLASLCMVDFFFRYCTLQKLYAKVMADNIVAVKYNARLGFKPFEEPDHKTFLHYLLQKKDYLQSTARLGEMAETVGDGSYEIVIEGELLSELKGIGAIMPENSEKPVTIVK